MRGDRRKSYEQLHSLKKYHARVSVCVLAKRNNKNIESDFLWLVPRLSKTSLSRHGLSWFFEASSWTTPDLPSLLSAQQTIALLDCKSIARFELCCQSKTCAWNQRSECFPNSGGVCSCGLQAPDASSSHAPLSRSWRVPPSLGSPSIDPPCALRNEKKKSRRKKEEI